MKKTSFAISALLLIAISAQTFQPCYAQSFDDAFYNKTLRVDYSFAAEKAVQAVYISELHAYDYWAGRRVNLDSLPVEGNGSVVMKDAATGKVLYRTSFSSLFSEWCNEQNIELISPRNDGSAPSSRSNGAFEFVVNLPYPKARTEIVTTLYDKYRKVVAEQSFIFDPSDILVRKHDSESPAPYKYILQSGSYEDKIDVVIVAEGYTEAEMDVFYKDAEIAVEAILSHHPFDSLKERFNFIAVACPSKDSGVSEPLKGEWKNTAVGSNYSTFYVDRYLTTSRVRQMNDVLSGIPFEHIIVLANTDTYGGGGIYNSYTLTTAHHPLFRPVVVHEFGHSFGALADEYAYTTAPSDTYPYEIEPWERNITTKVDFASKWQDMIDAKVKGVGLYEGAGYTLKGIYRGAKRCRMLDNTTKQFCPVCQRALEDMILFYTEEKSGK